jgi:L-threonylcarbamoyladenylate synthase
MNRRMATSSFGDEAIAHAVEVLRRGGLVAFPTETVYGLGARADSSEAVRRIYEAKGRPSTNPSIVHVASAEAAFALAREVPEAARALAARFWPGPLTLVLSVRPGAVAPEVLAGGDTIALRVPAHPAARALLEAVALPIAAPSANRSTSVSPTAAEHVEQSLGDRVELVLDAGPTGYGIESTIVDACALPLVLLRHGSISLEAIASLAAVVDAGARIDDERSPARAPGGQLRHYAPRAEVELVDEGALAAAVARAGAASLRVGSLARTGTLAPSASLHHEALPADPEGYARALYAALHRLDALGLDRIVVAELPEGAPWRALRDKLARAAAPR